MKINDKFDVGFSTKKFKPRECFNEFYKGKSWADRNNAKFGDDLLKRCFIIKLLWDNSLCLDINLLKDEFTKEYGDGDVDKYIKEIKDQGLIVVSKKDNKIYATQKEVNRVRIEIKRYLNENSEDDDSDL